MLTRLQIASVALGNRKPVYCLLAEGPEGNAHPQVVTQSLKYSDYPCSRTRTAFTEMMMYYDRVRKVFNTLPMLIALAMFVVCKAASAQGTGATLVINHPSGFANVGSDVALFGHSTVVGSAIQMTSSAGGHLGGTVWSTTPPNIQSFTTNFTFQVGSLNTIPAIAGLTFSVQNSNSTTNPDGFYGLQASATANLADYGAFKGQNPIGNSIAVKYDLNFYNQQAYRTGGYPNSTGLYTDGGPLSVMLGENDLNPFGINLYSGHVFAGSIVYDGTLLTMTIKDTTTNAQARYVWPINIPALTGSNTAWVGFTANQTTEVLVSLLSWQYYTGYNTRLATPTFSIAPGPYTSTQSVSLSGPAGATIYYTTNGQLPTSSSTQYTGTPISVSANEVIQAVAIESGYTDSLVATGNYQIQSSGTPQISFPNFSSPNGLIQVNGAGYLSGPSLVLSDTSSSYGFEAAGAWYPVPVNVQTFSTTFTYQATSSNGSGQYGLGATFCIQNMLAETAQYGEVTGGPTYVGNASNAFGYGYNSPPQGGGGLGGTTGGLNNSVAVKFDLTNNSTGLYTNGNIPGMASVSGVPDVPITGGLNLSGGNPITVAFTYNGATLSMMLTDTVTSAKFSHSWTINIPSMVGANTAYIGFTAGTGYWHANQYIKSWSYAASQGQTAAVPAAPSNLRVQ